LEEYKWPSYQPRKKELVTARTIPPSRRSLTGLFPSRKNDGLVPFESALERDLIVLLEFDESVLSYEAQPLKLHYRSSGGRPVVGHPDFLVRYRYGRGGPPMLCDVKYRQELREDWSRLRPRLKAAAVYARERGWGYRIQTDREIRTAYLENARFLLPYANRAPHPEHELVIIAALIEIGPTTVQELLEAICADPWNRAQLIPTLWCLVGRHNIETDYNRPLGVDTPLWFPNS
jgi:hypothetical protein